MGQSSGEAHRMDAARELALKRLREDLAKLASFVNVPDAEQSPEFESWRSRVQQSLSRELSIDEN